MWSFNWKMAELAMRREHNDPRKGAADLPVSEAEAAPGPSCVCTEAMSPCLTTDSFPSHSPSFPSLWALKLPGFILSKCSKTNS